MTTTMMLIFLYLMATAETAIIDIPTEASRISGTTTFTLFTDSRTWKEARKVCRKYGGYLITIDTEGKYNRYIEMKTQDFSSDIGTPWTGLYWTSLDWLYWDAPGCPPPNAERKSTYHWRGSADANFKNTEKCYRQKDNGLENRPCSEKNTFICETFQADSCNYIDKDISVGKNQQVLTDPTLSECQSDCDNQLGCFMTGVIDNDCVMIFTPDIANNNTLSIKDCGIEKAVVTEAIDVPNDGSDPTECIFPSVIRPLESCSIQTITETSTATVFETKSVIETETVMVNITQTETETMTETVSINVTQTEEITVTTTEGNIIVVTPSAITTTIYNSASTVVEISTIIVTEATIQITTVTEASSPSWNSCDGACTATFTQTEACFTTANILPTEISSTTLESNVMTIFSSSIFGGYTGSDGVLRTHLCRDIIYVTVDESVTEQAVQSIFKELSIDTKNLSAVLQKKISSKDNRTSSVAIGYVGIVFLVIPFVLIIIVDMPTFYLAGRDVVVFCKESF